MPIDILLSAGSEAEKKEEFEVGEFVGRVAVQGRGQGKEGKWV